MSGQSNSDIRGQGTRAVQDLQVRKETVGEESPTLLAMTVLSRAAMVHLAQCPGHGHHLGVPAEVQAAAHRRTSVSVLNSIFLHINLL